MKISPNLTEEAVLAELGARLALVRVEQNLTQAALAEQAGVSKRTIERLEAGAVGTQLSGFVRVCRALALLDRFDLLVPEPVDSPMAKLKLQGRRRRRATGEKSATPAPKKWTWGDSA